MAANVGALFRPVLLILQTGPGKAYKGTNSPLANPFASRIHIEQSLEVSFISQFRVLSHMAYVFCPLVN
jgi:hypothetical protein